MDRSAKHWTGGAKKWAIMVAGFVWCATALLVLAIYTARADGTAQDMLLVYFQPMLPITVALWLWGHNVQRFHALSIEYEICFSAKDRKHLLPAGEIYRIALVVTNLCLTCAAAFAAMAASGAHGLADFAPLVMYFGLLLLLMAPVNVLVMPSRLFFGETLLRALVPVQEVSWADFLLADVITSLSKSSGDLAKAFAVLMTGPALHMLASSSGAHSPAHLVNPLALPVLLALCLPYLIRFVQCLIVNRTTGNRSQLFNAAKYATAFPALVLTAFEHERHVQGERYEWFHWWVAAMLLNSLYSFYWDLEMDWDMPWMVQPGALHVLGVLRLPNLKADAFYSRRWYVWAMVSNLVLRLAWTHRLMGRLEALSTVALVIAVLEVFRRYQWTYIRVETEIRKLRLKQTHEHPRDEVQPKSAHETL